MQALKEALRAYLRGETGFEAVRAATDTALASLPRERHGDIEKLLKAARAAGLKDTDFVALASRVLNAATPTDETPADHLSTVVLPASPAKPPVEPAASGGEDDFIETVVLPGGAADIARAKAAAAAVAARGADDDATVFAGDDDGATAVPEQVEDDDATVLASDDDRTVLADDDDTTQFVDYSERTDLGAIGEAPEADAAGDDEMATEIGASAGTEDATEIGAGAEDATEVNAALDDDVTAVNQALADADDEDATAINAAADDDDATAINAGADDDDATAVNADSGDPDRTEVVGDAGSGFDIFAEENLAAADGARERSGGSWPTGVPPAAPTSGAGISRDYGAGDRIRDRFELISKLGEGGMGAVWKAKDLLKEEARDRNPFVAMKLLQGDFKSHPEAFIALQRETAKQQRLAHPNIATVYDFDRDSTTGTVFMTMEVMEGQPLDAFVRKLPADGLPPEEAMPLIEQLCRGLQYAHDNGLVHSDLKPGNCFLTKENTVKLLDFGIARASKTKTDAEGETTLFDPGQLGALTPTYATIEMFDGKDPDPRDDIYALAIITYQLLTGKHPYGKKSAPKARELKLEPAPVPTLNKAQNKALRRGLAFLREDRTPTVTEFLEGITPRKSRTGLYVGGAIAALLIIAILSYTPVVNELDRREREQIVSVLGGGDLESLRSGLAQVAALPDAEQRARLLADDRVINAVVDYIAKGDKQSIADGRALLEPFPDDFKRRVMNDERTRRAIVDYYEGLRIAAANPAEKRYDFPAAQQAIEELKKIYPDSATVYRIETDVQAEKDTLLNELGNRYNDLLTAGMLIPDPQADDIGDVVALVRQIDPENRLLKDDSLRFEFEKRVQQAMSEKDFATAKRYLDASLAYAPDDPTLSDLRYQVETELKRIADQKLVAEIQQRLRAEYPTFASLADFQRVRDDLIRLADLDPTNPVLTEIQNSLKSAFGKELDRRIQAATWNEGENLLVDYAKLLDIPYVTEKRGKLSEAERKAGFTLQMTPERQKAVNERVERLRALIAEPKFTSDWEIAFRVPYKELIALLPLGDPALEPVREATANLYLGKAKQAREAGRFAEALAFVDRGRTFYPGFPGFDVEQQAVASAQEVLRKQREEQERLAKLERRKGELLTAAQADDVDKASQILEELRRELPADDAFIVKDAPQAIARSYLALARQQAENKQFDNAVTFASRGLQLAPETPDLKEALRIYQEEVAKRAEQIAVAKLFNDVQPLDVAALSKRVAGVRKQFPDDWQSISRGYAQARAERLASVQTRSADDVLQLEQRIAELRQLLPDAFKPLEKELATLVASRLSALDVSSLDALARPLAEARKLFPRFRATLDDGIGSALAKRIKALEAKNLRQAHDMLASARKLLPDSDPLKGLRLKDLPKPSKYAPKGLAQVEAGQLSAAYATLQQMQAAEPDHAEYPAFKAALDQRLAQAQAAYRQFASLIQARRKTEGCAALSQAMQAWSDSPDFEKASAQFCRDEVAAPKPGECSVKLAGYGAKSRAACWDELDKAGVRGPTMVVVPAGGGIPKAFAIGKYEVTVADYNAYCKASGKCQARSSDQSLPVTNVSLAEAEAYAKWLSQTTGKSYRLPTDSEWEYAANAGGKLPSQSDYNCRVESGGTIIKGLGLVDAQSGKPNGWGLINFVGNAQEWVKSAGGASTRGGAFDDPLTRCGVKLNESHSGSGDPVTGFRLVRDLG